MGCQGETDYLSSYYIRKCPATQFDHAIFCKRNKKCVKVITGASTCQNVFSSIQESWFEIWIYIWTNISRFEKRKKVLSTDATFFTSKVEGKKAHANVIKITNYFMIFVATSTVAYQLENKPKMYVTVHFFTIWFQYMWCSFSFNICKEKEEEEEGI